MTFDVVMIERNKRTYHVFPVDYHKFQYSTGEYIPAILLEPIDYENAINRIDIIELALAKRRIALREKHLIKLPKQLPLLLPEGDIA